MKKPKTTGGPSEKKVEMSPEMAALLAKSEESLSRRLAELDERLSRRRKELLAEVQKQELEEERLKEARGNNYYKEPPPEIYEPGFREKFEAMLLICPTSGCHLWTGFRGKGSGVGYGSISIRGVGYRAHRVSWWLYRTRYIPNYIAHRCDVPACVNPDHLFLATARENIQDCYKKGRHKGVTGHPNRRPIPRRDETEEQEGSSEPPGPVFFKLL